GIVGNIGQCDYSTANAFLDNYAGYRHELFQTGKRFGKTISINWPLWKDGGMQMDETAQKLIIRRTGIMPLATSAGLEAFDYLLAQTGHPGALIAAGKADKIRNTLDLTTPLSTARQTIDAKPSSDTNPVFQKQVEEDLVDICVDLLKVEKTDIDKETEFSEYGVDSILIMQVLEKLEEKYKQTVEAAVILEHATITTLARHLIDQGIAKTASKTAPSLSQQSVAPGFVPELISEKGTRFGYVGPDSSGKRKIAVIGQACRLPQSSTIEQFWSNLAAGRDLISLVPPERWDPKMFYSEDRSDPNKAYTNHGGFIDDIGYFDAGFFKMQDHEALTMDPQQRIILELTQALFDDAGYDKEDVNETKTGIFIGAKDNNYTRSNYHLIPPDGLQHTIVNSISNMIAARASDCYNLVGPSKTIDTACSSALVAVDDACESILNGNSDMAVAGGVFLMPDPFMHVGFSKAKVLSEDGKSYVFDERAKGFVLGEGAGLVLLKDYDAAIRDHDRILATILGSAVNNDGRTIGVTVPNKEGQKAVIQAAIDAGGITPETIGYFEAHGTGTLLGDPIEIKAATEVYKGYTDETGYCAVGSVKSNLGHTMTAAGVISLIKVILSLQHRQIPATLHCRTPHPRFKFDESPFYPNTQLKPWHKRNGVRRAAVSSFGFGGT
ncbi:MAG: KR domain-containing protein, partial [bacterium]|nr:KR domain-containing protein [bacterium]